MGSWAVRRRDSVVTGILSMLACAGQDEGLAPQKAPFGPTGSVGILSSLGAKNRREQERFRTSTASEETERRGV